MRSAQVQLFAIVAFLAIASSARAHPAVDAARTAYGHAEFRICMIRLDEAHTEPNLDADELAQLYWYRGACAFALGQHQQAAMEFDRLLKLQPLFEPSTLEAGPALDGLFQSRRAVWHGQHGVSLADPVWVGSLLSTRLMQNPHEVLDVVAFIRARGEPKFEPFPLRVDGVIARGPIADARLWQRLAVAGVMELVLEARSSRRTAVARLGSAREPLVVPVTARHAALALSQLRPQPARAIPHRLPVVENAPPSNPVRVPAAFVSLGAAGLVGLAASAGLIAATVAGAVSIAGYAGMWALPHDVGGDRKPTYRAAAYSWLGGAGVLAVLLPASLGLLIAAGAVVTLTVIAHALI